MEKSKVYFTDFRSTPSCNLLTKLQNLCSKAGIGTMDLKGKFVAVKIHFGEAGNLSYLRPNYAKALCDLLKDMGGKPFLTDCNTLYVGSRRNALDHLETAYENGFNPFQTGVQSIIADGLLGTDDVAVPINGTYCKEALIGRAIMDADVVISLSHFKGHEATGFGGALKNLGMGSGSCAGKRHMHYGGKPSVHAGSCVGCGRCAKACAHNAISFPMGENGKRHAFIDHDKCVGCDRCVGVCADHSAILGPDSANDELTCKIAEYAWAVIKDRPNFHVTLVNNVSPFCDCYPNNDAAVLPDIGMFASFDPVALDVACADACNAVSPLPDTYLTDAHHHDDDAFCRMHPTTNWRVGIAHAEKLGMGTSQYELIRI